MEWLDNVKRDSGWSWQTILTVVRDAVKKGVASKSSRGRPRTSAVGKRTGTGRPRGRPRGSKRKKPNDDDMNPRFDDGGSSDGSDEDEMIDVGDSYVIEEIIDHKDTSNGRL